MYIQLIKKTKKYKFILLLVILVVITSVVFSILKTQDASSQKNVTTSNLEVLAQEIIQKCKNTKYIPTCYENEIPRLMEKPNSLSMEDTFQLSKVIQRLDDKFPFCHVLGHKIASKETHKDVTQWKEVIKRCPSGLCSNGCVHGAFQERFRTEFMTDEEIAKIKPELNSICQSGSDAKLSGIQQGSCYHALGHLLAYITNAKFDKATALCEELSKNEMDVDFTKVCFDGVFMQVFQPIEPEDFALIKNIAPQVDQVETFCAPFTESAHASCWIESWPLKVDQFKSNPNELIKFCSFLDGAHSKRCFNTMFYIMPIQFHFDDTKIIDYCKQFPADLSGNCFAQFAQRLIQTDNDYIQRAINFCHMASQFDQNKECFSMLASMASFNFLPGSAEYKTMCTSLPEMWADKCK